MLFNPMRRNGSFDNGLLSQYVISGLLTFISVIYTWWFTPPFPCPFNTIDFGYSTARRFAISACTAIAKDHPLPRTPSSFIQHVKELSYLKFVLLLQDTSCWLRCQSRYRSIVFEQFRPSKKRLGHLPFSLHLSGRISRFLINPGYSRYHHKKPRFFSYTFIL